MDDKYGEQLDDAFRSEFDDDGEIPTSSTYKYWPAFKAGWDRAIAFMEQRAPQSAEIAPSASPNSDYAAALRVIEDICRTEMVTHVSSVVRVINERLNALKAEHCA